MTIEIAGPVAGAAIAFGGVVFGLLVNGDRAERQRRRDLHGRALAAVMAYSEMPFMIRRRRYEDQHASEERVRLSDHFSAVKAEMSTCQVLLAADGDEALAAAYDELVETARATAGREAHEAWTDRPVASDGEMNMGPLFERLEPLRQRLGEFELKLARATLPRRKRVRRWMRVRRGQSPQLRVAGVSTLAERGAARTHTQQEAREEQ